MTEGQPDTEVKSLELEHVKVYRELMITLDKLIQRTMENKLAEGGTNIDGIYDAEMNNFKDLKLGTFQDKQVKDGELDSQNQLILFLRGMVRLRLKILEQQMMSGPILKAIHGDGEEESEVFQNRLLHLINEKDLKNIDTVKEIKKNAKLRRELGTTRVDSLDKLQLLRDKVEYYLEVCNDVKSLKVQRAIRDNEYEDFAKLRRKYKSLVRKDQILSQFNVNLVSSLSNADIANDNKLKDIVMYCGDYCNYGFFDEDNDGNEEYSE